MLNSDIRSFSSYTKGLHTISEVSNHENEVNFKIRLSVLLKTKLEKRISKFQSSGLSIDGVYSKIVCIQPTTETEHFDVVAKVSQEIFAKTTLTNLTGGDKVNIGMISTNPTKWLLESYPVGKVKLVGSDIAKGHKHTKEMTFECSEILFNQIQKFRYVGLNASGVSIRESFISEGRYFFTIHVGRKTREITILGSDLLPGTELNLTLPFMPNVF